MMEQNYEMQADMEDSSERLEKKEQLRAKVQALVSYYEDEKRRNEELTMELERLKAEQQMQGAMSPAGGPPAPPMAAPGMPPGGMPPAGGIPFGQRPQQPPQQQPFQPPQNAFAPPQPQFPGMGAPAPGMPGSPAPGMPGMPGMAAPAPGPEFSPFPPQAPGGYTLQNFGAGAAPQGMPPQGMGFSPQPSQRPQAPQGPYGAPPPWQQPQQPQPPASPFGQFGQQQPYGQPQPPFGQPGFGQPGPQGMFAPPAYQNDGLADNIGLVLQTITQVRTKLQQFEAMRGYGYPPQPAYVDYDTVALLDKLYDQLGDLTRELMQRQMR